MSQAEQAELLRTHALRYGEQGYKVIPVHGISETGECTCGRENCKTPGKHPILAGSYEKYASDDPTIINSWWDAWPTANIAIVVGPHTGIWVLDLDIKNGEDGHVTLAEWVEQRTRGALPHTYTLRTGSGGTHMVWRLRHSREIRTRIRAYTGIDIKASGFVVVAPSTHYTGNVYTVEREMDPIYAPEDLIEWLESTINASSSLPSIEEMLKNGLPEGHRDNGIFHAAVTMLRTGMRFEDVREICRRIAAKCSPPFSIDEADAKVISAASYLVSNRQQEEWHSEAATAMTGESNPSGHAPLDDDVWPGFGGITDKSLGQRLAHFDSDVIPVEGGGWIEWNEEQGMWLSVPSPIHTASDLLDGVLRREFLMVRDEARQSIATLLTQIQQVGRMESVLRWYRTIPGALVALHALDPDPYMLKVKNGLLDLRTGDVRRPTREDFITRQCNVEWLGPDVPCPNWEQMLRWGTDGDEDAMDILQVFLGACLTGVTFKNFAILWGGGNNGKTMALSTLAWVLGTYANEAPPGLFTLRTHAREEHPTLLTELEGRRMVYFSEPGPGERLNTELLKKVTGAANLTARKMRQDYYNFKSPCKPVLDTNHMPGIDDFSTAIQERMVIVPFIGEIPRDARRPRDEIEAALRAEGPGILAWCYKGLQRLLKDGGGDMSRLMPQRMRALREQEFESRDVMGEWIEGFLIEEEGVALLSTEAWDHYQQWAIFTGVMHEEGAPRSSVDFSRKLNDRLRTGKGFKRRYLGSARISFSESGKVKRGRGWMGVRLMTPSEVAARMEMIADEA